MKKLKGFTLVEILIVIVIIGILIAALLPRMSAAQGRARDVARKNELSQIQSALVAYNGDHGHYPDNSTWTAITESTLGNALLEAGLSDVPSDPQDGSKIDGLDGATGKYWYKNMAKNTVNKAGIVLISHVEVAGSANYVMTSTSGLGSGGSITDIKDIKLCSDIVKSGSVFADTTGTCNYKNEDQLVYVLAY